MATIDETASDRTGKGALTSRGERTRASILEAALELFRERGYEEATMRAIATQAGVALGSAYYYFPSKEHLVQAFYRRLHEEHLRACADQLTGIKSLAERLRLLLRLKIEVSEPHHRTAALLFRSAADPESPLNPFSPASREVRDEAIALMSRAVEGSDVKPPKALAAELPRLLWLWEMGVILFWIHDRSAGRARTFTLIDRTSELVARLVGLASNPLLMPLRKMALRLLAELQAPIAGELPTEPGDP